MGKRAGSGRTPDRPGRNREGPTRREAAARSADPGVRERAPRRPNEELQIILDSVPAFIWFKDRDNRILRANRLAAKSMGTTVDALEGRSAYDIYPDEAANYHRDDLEVIGSGRAKLGIVEPLATVSGEKRWIRTDKIPYRDAAGRIIGVIVFAVDITERVLAEQELRGARDELERRVDERTHALAAALESLRAESEERLRAEEHARRQQAQLAHLLRLFTVEGMAAQLAHEINQPLAAIVNFASGLERWLANEVVDMKEIRWATEEIRRQALRAAEIVKRQRSHVRRSGDNRQTCDLEDVIREAAHLVEGDARRLGVTLRLVFDPGPLPVQIDRIQVEQVVLNLLHNALDAMDGPGRGSREIAVETVHDADQALVRVRDTGRGLPAGDPATLFEPFFTTKEGGLGMGLSISNAIVGAHGGRLWVEPNRGGGATFAFTLHRPSALAGGDESKRSEG